MFRKQEYRTHGYRGIPAITICLPPHRYPHLPNDDGQIASCFPRERSLSQDFPRVASRPRPPCRVLTRHVRRIQTKEPIRGKKAAASAHLLRRKRIRRRTSIKWYQIGTGRGVEMRETGVVCRRIVAYVERQLPLLGVRISLAGFRTRSSLPYPSSCPAIAGAVSLISCPCCPFASFAR